MNGDRTRSPIYRKWTHTVITRSTSAIWNLEKIYYDYIGDLCP